MRIYTLSGKAEHGKNFVADIISSYYQEEYRKKVCQLANGDYLKFLSKLAGWNGSKDEDGRKFLQEFGTEYIRNTINDNFWVDEVIKQINVLKKYYDVFVITDTRFPNEIARLEEKFGIENVVTLKVVRYYPSTTSLNSVFEEYRSSLTEEQLNHPSETSLNNYKFDHVLRNHMGKENILKNEIEDLIDYHEAELFEAKFRSTNGGLDA